MDQIGPYDETERPMFTTVDVLPVTPPHLDPEGADGWKVRVSFFRCDTRRASSVRMIHKVGVVGVTREAADAAADQARAALDTLGIEVRERVTS